MDSGCIGDNAILLSFVALLNCIIDPCFHYRKPSNNTHYLLHDERYQNDGIQKHFGYNALITGTSMTENFKTTEFNEIFDVNSVKTSYSGASHKEVNDAINTAIRHNGSLKIVVRSLDLSLGDADAMNYSGYPEYLYDDLWNDIHYLLNLDITYSMTVPSVLYSITGHASTTFDDYANWNNSYIFGADSVLKSYERPKASGEKIGLSNKEEAALRENIWENMEKTVKNNPKITFYYFIPPYSIVAWDEIVQKGELKKEMQIQQILIEKMIRYDNCYLFSWDDNVELVSDLENYKDPGHYGEWVNADILQWMHKGKDI